jgi:hypothetical protein
MAILAYKMLSKYHFSSGNKAARVKPQKNDTCTHFYEWHGIQFTPIRIPEWKKVYSFEIETSTRTHTHTSDVEERVTG